jgi:hypothetical protein
MMARGSMPMAFQISMDIAWMQRNWNAPTEALT